MNSTMDDITKCLDLAIDRLESIEAKLLLVSYIESSLHHSSFMMQVLHSKDIDKEAYNAIDEWIVAKLKELYSVYKPGDNSDVSHAISLASTAVARAGQYKAK